MIQWIKWCLFLFINFYLAAVLTVLPLANAYQWYRPQWILMLVIFCQIKQPQLFNPLIAWLLGLLMDSLQGTPLGEYALIFAVISYLTCLLRAEFMRRPLAAQVGKIFLLVCLGQIFVLWFQVWAGHNPHTLSYWMGSVMSCLAWPLLVVTLEAISQLFGFKTQGARRLL